MQKLANNITSDKSELFFRQMLTKSGFPVQQTRLTSSAVVVGAVVTARLAGRWCREIVL